MRTQRVIEELSGDGSLNGGQLNAPVEYEVTVWQTYIDDGRGEEVPGMKRVEARARFDRNEFRALHAAFDARAELVLTLDDGRQLPCYISSMPMMGDTLDLAARGGFK
jgi:hypothetical protein